MPFGIAVYGQLPLNDAANLMIGWDTKGYFVDGGIAQAIGAILVAGSPENLEAWHKELKKNKDWLKQGDTGISSLTIYSVMTGEDVLGSFGPDVPHDPSDFGRCYRLLKLHPEWVARLPELAQKYPAWTALVREWPRMTELYERDLETGKSEELHELMGKLRQEKY